MWNDMTSSSGSVHPHSVRGHRGRTRESDAEEAPANRPQVPSLHSKGLEQKGEVVKSWSGQSSEVGVDEDGPSASNAELLEMHNFLKNTFLKFYILWIKNRVHCGNWFKEIKPPTHTRLRMFEPNWSGLKCQNNPYEFQTQASTFSFHSSSEIFLVHNTGICLIIPTRTKVSLTFNFYLFCPLNYYIYLWKTS